MCLICPLRIFLRTQEALALAFYEHPSTQWRAESTCPPRTYRRAASSSSPGAGIVSMGNTTQNLRRNIPFTGLGFEGLRRITEEPLGTHATKFGEPGCRALRTFRCGRTTTRGGNLLCALVSLPGASGQLRATNCLNKKNKRNSNEKFEKVEIATFLVFSIL